jgi:hypothetical protein
MTSGSSNVVVSAATLAERKRGERVMVKILMAKVGHAIHFAATVPISRNGGFPSELLEIDCETLFHACQ